MTAADLLASGLLLGFAGLTGALLFGLAIWIRARSR